MSFPLNSKLPSESDENKDYPTYSKVYGYLPNNYTLIHIGFFLFCSYLMIKMTFFDHQLPSLFLLPMAFYIVYICEHFKTRWQWWEQVTQLRHYQNEIFPYLNKKYHVNLKIRTIGNLKQLLSPEGIQTSNGYVVKLSHTDKYHQMVVAGKDPQKEMIKLSKVKI